MIHTFASHFDLIFESKNSCAPAPSLAIDLNKCLLAVELLKRNRPGVSILTLMIF